MVALTVTRLSTTPIKGLQLHHPPSIDLTDRGAVGDRLFYLHDDAGRLQSCTRNQELLGLRAAWDHDARRLSVSRGDQLLLEGEVERGQAVDTDMHGLRTIGAELVADPVWSTFFSELLGRKVHLVQARTSAYDVQPATLLGQDSVADLARQAGVATIDARRFRMLIEFSGGPAYVEDSWQGREMRIGDAVLRGTGPVKRCAATTRHPETGTVDLQTLRMITAHRGRGPSVLGTGPLFGVYADVIVPGRVSVGDTIRHLGDS